MKNSSFTLLLLFIGLVSFSQEDEKANRYEEIHLSPRNLAPLSINLIYKRQISDKNTFFKLGFINLNGSYNKKIYSEFSDFPEQIISLNGGLTFGIEFRKEMSEKLNFFSGPNLIYSQSYSETKILSPDIIYFNNKIKNKSYAAGVSYTIGLLYQINKNFLISTDISPSIIYRNNLTKNSFINENTVLTESINFELNNSALFSLAYRF